MKLKTEAKIGIIVIATIALVIWGINFLKGRNILKRSDVFYSTYNNVNGLGLSSPVTLNGYKVGLINNISFKKGSLNEIVVAYTVAHEFDIPKGTIAEIYSADITGTKAIRLLPANAKEMHHFGDTLISAIQLDMIESLKAEFLPLKDKLESLTANIDTVVIAAKGVFDSTSSHKLKLAIDDFSEISSELNNKLSDGGSLDVAFKEFSKFATTLSNNREKMDTIFQNMAYISDSIAKSNVHETINSMNKTLTETHLLLEKVNNGEGSLGLMASSDSLYLHLSSASKNLDLLLEDLREHPKRYVHFSVFGKKDK